MKNKLRSSITANRIFLTLAASSFAISVGGIGCSHDKMAEPSPADDTPQAAAGTDAVPPTADAAPDANASGTPNASASSTPDNVSQDNTPLTDTGPTLASADPETAPAPPHHHKKHREPSAAPTEDTGVAVPVPSATPAETAAVPPPVPAAAPVAMPVTPPPAMTPPPQQAQVPPPARPAYTPPPAAEVQEEEPFYKKKSILLVGVLGILGIIGVLGFGRRNKG